MYLINRAAAIVKIKQPCLDWINSDSPVDLTLESVNEECNIYLLPEFDMPDEAQEIIADMYEDIVENELMGFCTDQEYLEFLRQVPELERMLVNSGIIVFKYWFSSSRAEQFRRFKSRQKDPLKQWKLSPVDMASLEKWGDYTKAKDDMMFHTNTKDAPWTIIRSDDKKRARVNCMHHFLSHLDYPDKDHSVVSKADPLIVGAPQDLYKSYQ